MMRKVSNGALVALTVCWMAGCSGTDTQLDLYNGDGRDAAGADGSRADGDTADGRGHPEADASGDGSTDAGSDGKLGDAGLSDRSTDGEKGDAVGTDAKMDGHIDGAGREDAAADAATDAAADDAGRPDTTPDADHTGEPDASTDVDTDDVSQTDATSDAGADDAPVPPDATADGLADEASSSDAEPDASGADAGSDAATCPTILLDGASDVGSQGWSIVMTPPASLSYGADYVRLLTSTLPGALTSGELLLYYPGALEVGQPFKIEVVMLVESVSAHNRDDSAAAIMASFTPQFGTPMQRDEMIYLDSAALGWGDDSQSFSTAIADNAYHTYVVSVDASNVAHVSIDGVEALTRDNFVTNGTIAIGDQTNQANIDSVLRIRSVTKLCP